VADDFSRLVSLACHDLRTPLATVQGFAKTLIKMDELEAEKRTRYLSLIDDSAEDLARLLDQLSLAARIESGRYAPTLQEADSLRLAPAGATGTGAVVRVDPEPVTRALAALQRAAARHGGVDVGVVVDGADVAFEPIVEAAAPVVLGDEHKDLGALVAVRVLRATGGEVALDGETLRVTLPT
jgi:signal transduction histidine kinase